MHKVMLGSWFGKKGKNICCTMNLYQVRYSSHHNGEVFEGDMNKGVS